MTDDNLTIAGCGNLKLERGEIYKRKGDAAMIAKKIFDELAHLYIKNTQVTIKKLKS
jgi:hypothetical protein